MLRLDVRHELDDADRSDVIALVTSVQLDVGHRPLSDQAWLELVHGGPTWHAAVLGRGTAGTLAAAVLIGRHASETGSTWTLELVADGTHSARHAIVHAVLSAARAEIAAAGGGDLRWWVFDVGADADELAASIGLVPGRALLQMRVPLPLPAAVDTARPTVPTRPFTVGQDETDWLEVNNAAFAWHPEQGNWDRATLELREREDWFDPEGFLLHERDGRLAAFCWTKLHRDSEPVLGEIYVIAVHPDFHGLGLGRALTVAGLDSIASHGIATGMLFVDLDNTSAVGLYESLGFHVHRTDRAYTGHIEPSTGRRTASNVPTKEQP
jgi:mycothiol synthase